MDLGAYANIENLSILAAKNNIEVPRLRGYRLMKNETKVNYKDTFKEECEFTALEDLITAIPRYSLYSNMNCYSSTTQKLIRKYFKNKKIVWNEIHGEFRKKLKFLIKIKKRQIKEQYEMFNKYCGREDVLYIHARIGGNNWNYYNGEELRHKEWFLDKVDDSYDCTYCDIYALIKN